MAMRSIWKGTISFGMVRIPAKLYSAAEDKRVAFHLMHRDCRNRIQLPKWCPACERKLEPTEIQRVYEYAKGQYVPMEEADLQALPLKTLKTVEVVEFVDPSGIDPRVIEKSYFLAPDETDVQAYCLLLTAMEKTGLCAVGKLAYREREHLSLLRPYGRVLLLQTLFYADELRDPNDIAAPEVAVSERDLSMALTLVNALKTDGFDLSKYQDDYRQALYQLVEAKMAGKEVEIQAAAPTGGMDLSASLKASIEEILAKKGVKADKVPAQKSAKKVKVTA